MTFACPPEGQSLVEVEGNFLTPDHHVAIGRGEWSTAGALANPDTESTTKLAHTVYNIKLQSGGQIELGNKIYAATLGARFDAVDLGQDPIYSEEATRYLQDFAGSSTCCSVGVVTWGVGFHGGGGVCPPWIKLLCDMSMVPAVRSAAVVSPG